MGMFDSLYDSRGNEWQTKAFDCLCDRYEIGDAMPDADAPPPYQVKVFGGPWDAPAVDSFATVRDGALVMVPDVRDAHLPLLDYHGGIAAEGI